jgi:hypothetical protein
MRLNAVPIILRRPGVIAPGAGNISVTVTTSPSATDFTTDGSADWIMDTGSNFATQAFHRKGIPSTSFVGLIGTNMVNCTSPGWGHTGTNNTSDAGDAYDGVIAFSSAAFGHDAAIAGDAKLQLTFPAGSGTRHANIYFQPDTTESMSIRFTLSDGSATEQLLSVPALGSETRRLYSCAYNSAGAGILTVSLETGVGLSSVSYFLFDSCSYKTS